MLAVGVYQAGRVRHARLACDELPGDRFAGGAVPPLPFLGRMGLPVGVQEQVRADRAAPVLHLEQAQGAAVERGLVPAAPLVPVGGQGGVVGGGPAGDLAVPMMGVQAIRGRQAPLAASPKTQWLFLEGLNRPKYRRVIQRFGFPGWLRQAHL